MNEPTLIYETVHGSQAYNLARPDSDTDHKGIMVGPPSWYLGILDHPEQIEVTKDHVLFELRKFLRLALSANPTIIEVLWTAPRFHTHVSPIGEELLDIRDRFLSKRVWGSFGKYAMSQLKRIKNHRQWLMNPPKKEPTRADFGLPEHNIIPREQLGAAEKLLKDGTLDEAELTPNFLEIMAREKRYRSARRDYKHHKTWKKKRNPDRAALEEEFGYDTKHAQHLMRLLRMAKEILTEHIVHVYREDREELLAVRAGAWSYDQLIERAEALWDEVDQAAEDSTLPDRADREAIDARCVEWVGRIHRGES